MSSLCGTEVKPILCLKCFFPVTFSDKDRASNNSRLREQASFRKRDEAFNFKFQATCPTCGTVYLERFIKNARMTA